jgi:hypothetical protein
MEIEACLRLWQADLEFELYFGNVPARPHVLRTVNPAIFQNGNAISHLISLRITLVRT